MISLETQFSGGQIARALMNDEEEMAYFLVEFVDEIDGDDAAAIRDHIPYGQASNVAEVLRCLADSFDPPKEEATP